MCLKIFYLSQFLDLYNYSICLYIYMVEPAHLGLFYQYNEKKEIHYIRINEKTYEFDTKDLVFVKLVEDNSNFMEVLFNIRDLAKPFGNKISQKFSDLEKVANHIHYTSLESYLDHVKILLEFRKKNPEKKEMPSDDSLDRCCICLCELYDEIFEYTSEKIRDQLLKSDDNDAIRLAKCQGHYFHKLCLDGYLKSQKQSFLTCPICKTFYGIMRGTINKPTL